MEFRGSRGGLLTAEKQCQSRSQTTDSLKLVHKRLMSPCKEEEEEVRGEEGRAGRMRESLMLCSSGDHRTQSRFTGNQSSRPFTLPSPNTPLKKPQGQAVCGGAVKQTVRRRVEMSDGKLHRPADSQTVGTADRLAVGVSPLTRPDSFHAGSCDSEREDRVVVVGGVGADAIHSENKMSPPSDRSELGAIGFHGAFPLFHRGRSAAFNKGGGRDGRLA
ncbi:hypothetical protein PAMA_006331 [Pampus argenteus]